MADLPALGRALLDRPEVRDRRDLELPSVASMDAPVRAVQFGTGAFLRGFVDAFLDTAREAGCFDGRVVAIGSTGSGRDRALNDQDGLYTLVVQGISDGEQRQEQRVIASIERAVASSTDWTAVLEYARSPHLDLIFSNTTEVGITLDEGDDPSFDPPRSFPGKLTRFLLERGRAFDFAPGRGVVVLPCELIENNGDRLRAIVLALAERWNVESEFTRWIRASVPFCNTLVDRIVPGTPSGVALDRVRERLGYDDGMITVCEPYRLFAIQGDDALRARLGFAAADEGVIVEPDIGRYRLLKVRLLNGTHTIMVPLALLCGFRTVADAVTDDGVGAFTRRVMLEEIAPGVDTPDAERYARTVIDRFANPFIDHDLWDITLYATAKMRVRVVPSILAHAAREGGAPRLLALGFAAYLLFMRGDLHAARAARARTASCGGRI
jgi:tagaturonate reductase